MDRASLVLAQPLRSDVSNSYRALADRGKVPYSTLYHRARGRRSQAAKAQSQQYLSPCEEHAVVKFLLLMADLGQPMRIKQIPSLAFAVARQRPIAKRPHSPPSKNWVRAFEKRHPETQSRRLRALDWNRHEKNIYTKTVHWFKVIGRILQDPKVLAENVYNMDETGVMLSMPGATKVLVSRSDTRDYRGARIKRTTITAVECISADGRCLNPMIIWPATTHRSNWTTFPTPGWQYACSESGYTDSHISLQWLTRIFDLETKERAQGKPRVLICDGFGTHETLEILEHCFANNIILCRLPSHTSHKLQPCDVAVFSPLKAAYREQIDRLERGGVNTIGKEHFTSLYSSARETALSNKNIRAGFAASGLFPFNPDRVLRTMPKPLLIQAAPDASEAEPDLCSEVIEPQTPITPVSIESLMSLKNLIIEADAKDLDLPSKQKLERHLQKLTRATQKSLAESALQLNHIHFLTTMNNEAKVRRSTKSLVLGTARVMGYKELEDARAKRAQKDAARVAKGKGKQSRKRKSAVPESDAQTLVAEIADAQELDLAMMATTHVSIPPDGGSEVVIRAPIAKMW